MTYAAKPLIMTSGDPSGVGPELSVEAFRQVGDTHPFAVLGDPNHLQSLAEPLGIRTREIASPADVQTGALNVIPQAFSIAPKAGAWQPENASGTVEMIERAVSFVKSGDASAMITNPINKKVLIDGAQFPYPGHTEFLAALDGKERSVMLLASPELSVVPVTIHIAVQDVPAALTQDLLSFTIRTLDHALRTDFALKSPRIAVAGLNPHAGEGGEMGMEEIDLIAPTLEALRRERMDIIGPESADTMFHARARKHYDAAVCMYHDQALIPIKTIDFDRGVNTTLGLSFIRTSPDHGTAYDIAGKGVANPSSLLEAIKMAAKMAKNRALLNG